MTEGIVRGGQFNIGHICTRHQCEQGRGDKIALRWLSAKLEGRDVTFRELDEESSRFAQLLADIGLAPGEVVFTFLPRTPEQYFALLGALKLQLIAGPLFSSFGEEALYDRLHSAGARAVITSSSLARKILPLRSRLPELRSILLVDADHDPQPGILGCRSRLRQTPGTFTAPRTGPEVPSLLHFTSGSTGRAKGVLHVHRSVLMQSRTAREVLGLGDADRYWCTADPGWVTGTSYGLIGPWSLGVTQVQFAGGFDPRLWMTVLEREKISVWYTAPTALRLLMREEDKFFLDFGLEHLRHICSVGEPLNAEVVRWGRRVFGRELYDTWFQTETGAIMIANRPGLPVKPGSMGVPVAGVEADLLPEKPQENPGREGILSLKIGWPSMFTTYLGQPQAYREKFRHDYYLTGDIVSRDEDGYIWFLGRSDDVINTAGHLVSPFEVESCLIEAPEVAEAAIIGAPDPVLFEKIVAFICLLPGHDPSPELELRLRIRVANRVSTTATPQELFFVPSLPRTRSGKIMRRLLKAGYLQTDAGDLSTLEDDPAHERPGAPERHLSAGF